MKSEDSLRISSAPKTSAAADMATAVKKPRTNGYSENRLMTRWANRNKPTPPVAQVVPESIPIDGRVLAVFTDYDGLHKSLARRREELQMTMEQLDFLSGNQSGYSAKLLTKTKIKKLGRLSLGSTVGGLGCRLALLENETKTAAILKSKSVPRLHGRSLTGLNETLGEIGCVMALLEDARASEKIMERCSKRRRPLRPHANAE